MLEAAALGRPDETAVLEEAQVVVQRHPGGAGLGEQGALGTAGQAGFHQFQALLVAALALEGDALRIAPVHPGQVDVRVAAQVDPLRLRAGERGNHPQLHPHVGIAGGRVALLDHLHAVGIHLVALLHRHRAFIDARKGNGRIIRRPPVTGVAVHFLVGDELGHAVADDRAAVRRELYLLAAGQIDHPQVALADEADKPALGRDLRVGGEAFAVGELAHRAAGQLVQVQLAGQREQQALGIGRELVIDDATHRGDALALAAGLLGITEHFLARQHDLGIDQQPGLPGGDVVLPQVQLVAVGLLATQEGHPRTVRGHLRLEQGRTGQRTRAGDRFQGEFFGVGNGGHGKDHGKGKQQGTHWIPVSDSRDRAILAEPATRCGTGKPSLLPGAANQRAGSAPRQRLNAGRTGGAFLPRPSAGRAAGSPSARAHRRA